MRILKFTDNHFCEASSILRKFGTKYSVRLENQIQSLNWLEQLAVEKGCDAVICGGDFFNTPTLNENEITAVKDIQWNNLPHYFIVGNHESGYSSLQYSSTKMLEDTHRNIVYQPEKMVIHDTELCFLPYIVESDRKPLDTYFGNKNTTHRIIFSHNDIKGIQLGPVESKTGFTISEIEDNCDLFINGHLHNGTQITNKIINIGNLTGQNFSENALIYSHNIMILDTDTLQYELIENPYAINFYKLEFETEKDFNLLKKLKNNAVVSIKCIETIAPILTEQLKKFETKIIESKISVIRKTFDTDSNTDHIEELTFDHLAKLYEFCKEKLGETEIIEFELSELCK